MEKQIADLQAQLKTSLNSKAAETNSTSNNDNKDAAENADATVGKAEVDKLRQCISGLRKVDNGGEAVAQILAQKEAELQKILVEFRGSKPLDDQIKSNADTIARNEKQLEREEATRKAAIETLEAAKAAMDKARDVVAAAQAAEARAAAVAAAVGAAATTAAAAAAAAAADAALLRHSMREGGRGGEWREGETEREREGGGGGGIE